MKRTEIKYWATPKCIAHLTRVLAHGTDEKGFFLIPESTIYYPGGGGQPKDMAEVFMLKQQAKIIEADFNNGFIKHYLEIPISGIQDGEAMSIKVFGGLRTAASCIHTVGHWITGIVTENLELPLKPIKGYHFFEGPYIEFEGDMELLDDTVIDQINMAIAIDKQSNLKVSSVVELPVDNNSGVNEVYQKPLRTVTIEGYKGLGCGGTHIENLREIKSARATKIYKKNGRIRISYHVNVWEEVAS